MQPLAVEILTSEDEEPTNKPKTWKERPANWMEIAGCYFDNTVMSCNKMIVDKTICC